MTLTAPQIRCLLAILSLSRMEAAVASKDVAKLLGISRPSVHKMLDILAQRGLLYKEHYGTACLSEEGTKLTEALEMRKEKLLLLFSQNLGLPLDEGNVAATLWMSALREDTLQSLESLADRRCAP